MDKLNEQFIDCMSKKVKAIDYCDKTVDKKYPLASAKVKDNSVDCLIASKIEFKYECDSSSDTYCDDKKIGCFMVAQDFALRLKLVHSSILKVGKKNQLNCYFLSDKALEGK
jgi:hypothetical protein